MHRLLERQLKRYLGSVENIPADWQRLLSAVDEAYHQADVDRGMIERSLDLTSQELLESNQQLGQQVAVEQARAKLMEESGQALLSVIQAAASGRLDVEVRVPEGEDVFVRLAAGLKMMVSDIREMMAGQDSARVEIEEARAQLEAALEDVLAAQRRYVREGWERYTGTEAGQGPVLLGNEPPSSVDGWLPAVTAAVEQADIVVKSEGEAGVTLAAPIALYGEVFGVLGFERDEGEVWSEGEINAVRDIVEEVARALENQRLLDEEQRARLLVDERVQALDCLNDIGLKTEETPPIPDFLEWVAARIPSAMRHSHLCRAAIELDGRTYGSPEVADLSSQIAQELRIAGESLGAVRVGYTEKRSLDDQAIVLLGDIARRVGGYVEGRRLFQQAQDALAEVQATHRRYLRETWDAFLQGREMGQGYIAGPEGIGPVESVVLPEMNHAMADGQVVTLIEEPSGETERTRSALAVPLKSRGGQTIGVVDLYREGDSREWSEAERTLVELLAEQIADSIEGERLFEQTQVSLAEVARLYEAGQRISRAESPSEIYEVVTTTMAGTTADQIAIWMFDSPATDAPPAFQEMVSFWDLAGAGPSLQLHTRYPVAQYSLARMLSQDTPFVSSDLSSDERLAEKTREMLLESGARAVAAIPLTVGNEWLGYSVVVVRRPRAFTTEELQRYDAVSSQAAIALRGQRLLQEAEGRARRETLIREITSKMRSTADLDTVLNTAVQELGRALGVSRAFVRLAPAEEDTEDA